VSQVGHLPRIIQLISFSRLSCKGAQGRQILLVLSYWENAVYPSLSVLHFVSLFIHSDEQTSLRIQTRP